MATKHGKKRSRGRFAAVRFQSALGLGALAASDFIAGTATPNFGNEAYLISADVTWAITGNTAGEGPIHVGLAHGDYTPAEIEEWLEATASIDPNDKIAQERNRRKCRFVGSFSGNLEEVLSDGKPIRTPLRFKVTDGGFLVLFGYNASGAILTTGANIVLYGTLYLKWQ